MSVPRGATIVVCPQRRRQDLPPGRDFRYPSRRVRGVVLEARPLSLLNALVMLICFGVYLHAMALSPPPTILSDITIGSLTRLAPLGAFTPFFMFNVYQVARCWQCKLSHVASRFLEGS